METTGLDWNDLPLVLTLEQVARVLQTGRTATYEAYRQGRLPGFKIGRRLRFAREAIRRAVGAGEPTEEAAHTLTAAGGGR
jgi:excisionase family DNA binding protein